MKRFFIILIVLLSCYLNLQAEEDEINNNAFGAGIGFFSVPDFDIWWDEFDSNVGFDRADTETSNNTFARFIYYDRMIGNHFSLGVIYIYQRFRIEEEWDDGRRKKSIIKWNTLMPRIKGYWGDNQIRVYAGIAVGSTYKTERREYSYEEDTYSTEYNKALQLTVIGVEVNVGNASLYTDLGFGMQGMWNLGAALKF